MFRSWKPEPMRRYTCMRARTHTHTEREYAYGHNHKSYRLSNKKSAKSAAPVSTKSSLYPCRAVVFVHAHFSHTCTPLLRALPLALSLARSLALAVFRSLSFSRSPPLALSPCSPRSRYHLRSRSLSVCCRQCQRQVLKMACIACMRTSAVGMLGCQSLCLSRVYNARTRVDHTHSTCTCM